MGPERVSASRRAPDPTDDLIQALALEPGALVAIAGAGGKSTLARTLAGQAVGSGWRVLLTSTTRMGWAQHEGPAWSLDPARPSQLDELLEALRRRASGAGLLALLGPRENHERHRGLPDTWPGLLVSERDPALAELVLVECDGARHRALKWPAPHEPVVPAGCTCLLVCVNLACLDQVLDDEHVHRSARACAALGVPMGTRIDPALLGRWLLHPAGYLARVPAGARGVVFFNAAERPAHAALLEPILPALLSRWERVLAGSAAAGSARVWAGP